RTLTSGKMGLLQRFRSGLGLDTLELKTAEGDQQETVVGVGKYLGEDVYFQVERGMAQGSTQVAVELELTPHLSLQSQASGFNQGIKFKWRYRY
ncbi:MAG: translocation/assembly module TamB domain-containing protein, partial [bacterium]